MGRPATPSSPLSQPLSMADKGKAVVTAATDVFGGKQTAKPTGPFAPQYITFVVHSVCHSHSRHSPPERSMDAICCCSSRRSGRLPILRQLGTQGTRPYEVPGVPAH